MSRISELNKIISEAQDELHRIRLQTEKDKNPLYIGKFYQSWTDDGHDETFFIHVTSIDDYGRLKGYMFKVHQWSNLHPFDVTFYLNEEYLDKNKLDEECEITAETFYDNFKFYKKLIKIK